jgi:hypothetical protein
MHGPEAATPRATRYQPVAKMLPVRAKHNMMGQRGALQRNICGAEHDSRFCQRAAIP